MGSESFLDRLWGWRDDLKQPSRDDRGKGKSASAFRRVYVLGALSVAQHKNQKKGEEKMEERKQKAEQLLGRAYIQSAFWVVPHKEREKQRRGKGKPTC